MRFAGRIRHLVPLSDIVVADSSVWISGLQYGGRPMRAIEDLRSYRQLVCCAYIRLEVERSLTQRFGWSPERVLEVMNGYLGGLPDVLLTGAVKGVCRDPKDDSILECALVARSKMLITGDKDLLVLHPWAGISILSPREYLSRYGRLYFD